MVILGGRIVKFVKKVYVSEIVGPRRRGRTVVRWKERVKENVSGRNEVSESKDR